MSSSIAHRPTLSQAAAELAVLCAVLAIIAAAVIFIRHEYQSRLMPRVDGSQAHYRTLDTLHAPGSKIPKYWVEFGKTASLVNPIRVCEGCTTKLEGFRLGDRWKRAIAWNVVADPYGKIAVTFRPGNISRLALFVTDGDSFERMARIMGGNIDTGIGDLHDGRWVEIPLRSSEISKGMATIFVSRLSGPNVAVSALIGF